MPYNKYRNREINERKVLHKIKKHWVVLSSALLMSLGGSALVSQNNLVHADQNNNAPKQVNKIGNDNVVAKDMNTRLTNANLSNHQNNYQNVKSQSPEFKSRNDQVIQTIMSRARRVHQQVFQNSMVNHQKFQQNNNVQGNVSHSHLGASQSNDDDSDIGTIVTRYIDDTTNKQLGSSSSDENYAEEPFTKQDKLGREGIAPKGYVFDKVLHDVNQYVGGKVSYFDIGVKPRSLVADRNQVTIYFDNVDDKNIPVRKFVQSDRAGTPFNVKQFEANVPDGYVLNHKQPLISGQQVTQYQPGNQIVRIGILPVDTKPTSQSQANTGSNSNASGGVNGSVTSAKATDSSSASDSVITNNNGASSNDKAHQQNGQINVQYVNPQGQVITHILLSRHVGLPFFISDFKRAAPGGYSHFVKVLAGQNVKNFVKGSQMVRLEMDKQALDNMKYGNIVINFVNAVKSGNTIKITPVGTPEIFTGRVNSPFDLSAEENFVPQGYYFDKVQSGNDVKQYTQAPQVVTFLVSKEPVQKGTVNIIYMNDGRVINSTSFTKPFGTPFNLKDYVPSGYQYAGHGSNLPTAFNGQQSTVMYVKPLANGSEVPMNLMYVNDGDGVTLDHKVIYGAQGSPLKLDQYIQSIPQGYHIVKINTVNHVNTFTPNGTVMINVLPNVKTVQSAESSAPQSLASSTANVSAGQSLASNQVTSNGDSQLNSSSVSINSASNLNNESNSQQPVRSTAVDHDNASQVNGNLNTDGHDSTVASDNEDQKSDSGTVTPGNKTGKNNGQFNEPGIDQTIDQALDSIIKLGANNYHTQSKLSKSNQNNVKLPQTGDIYQDLKIMAAVLISIGSSLNALEYALKRRQRKHGKDN